VRGERSARNRWQFTSATFTYAARADVRTKLVLIISTEERRCQLRSSVRCRMRLTKSLDWRATLAWRGDDICWRRRKGNINNNCLCVTVLCTIIMVHKVEMCMGMGFPMGIGIKHRIGNGREWECWKPVPHISSTKIRAVLTGRLTVSGFDLAWFSSLSSKLLCVFGLNGAI